MTNEEALTLKANDQVRVIKTGNVISCHADNDRTKSAASVGPRYFKEGGELKSEDVTWVFTGGIYHPAFELELVARNT